MMNARTSEMAAVIQRHESLAAQAVALQISVVVATFRRADVLRKTLEHLARQDLPPEQFEVIVVDDGSPDNTPEVVAAITPQLPYTIRFLRHENRGPGYTQNRGIEQARAPVVLLLADDIFLEPAALRAHLEQHRLHDGLAVAVLGKVVQSPELTQTVFLKKWDPFRFNALEDLEELPAYRFFAMNISVKRDFLLRNGLYLEHRGRGGPSCMEDLELGVRLKQFGLRLYYSKAALAKHYHVVTMDQAITRWHERGLNYGEFRRHAPLPELTVHFHLLNRHTAREYFSVLRGPNSFQGREKKIAWHLLWHAGRLLVLNAWTVPLFWRPLFDLAEKYATVASLVKPSMYRAFLYYHFLRGVRDGRRIFGD